VAVKRSRGYRRPGSRRPRNAGSAGRRVRRPRAARVSISERPGAPARTGPAGHQIRLAPGDPVQADHPDPRAGSRDDPPGRSSMSPRVTTAMAGLYPGRSTSVHDPVHGAAERRFWPRSTGPRDIQKPPVRVDDLGWAVEPPTGFEPVTYALREARGTAPGAPPAPIAALTSRNALNAQGAPDSRSTIRSTTGAGFR